MALSKRSYAATTAVLATALAALVLEDIYADWLVEGKPFWTTIVENTPPLAMAIGVLASGVWLYRNRSRLYVATVARWQVIGVVVIFALVGWVVGLQLAQGELKPVVIMTQTTIGGAVAGTLVGYANARTEETVESVQRERDRFRALFENTPSGTVDVELVDGEPIVRDANDAFASVFGDPAGASLFDAVDHGEATREAIRDHLAAVDPLETDVTAEVSGESGAGALEGRKHFELRVTPYGDGHAYLLYTDVTDLKETQRDLERSVARLERSNERLEEFAYIASHDLQEPMRTVSRYVEIIEDELGDVDPEVEEFMDTVVTGTQRMQSMVSGLLDYSRVTTRGEEFQPVDTEALVEEVRDDLELLAAEEDGRITVGSMPTVEADRDQLWQVFQNLVKNALEHSGEDPVAVEITATETDEGHRFVVEDDGPGVDPHMGEDVFQMFESGTNYHTSGEAKGIGLAVVERIVDRHGGEIEVESEPGEGSRFVFTIPE